jgi:hypothetical protein
MDTIRPVPTIHPLPKGVADLSREQVAIPAVVYKVVGQHLIEGWVVPHESNHVNDSIITTAVATVNVLQEGLPLSFRGIALFVQLREVFEKP